MNFNKHYDLVGKHSFLSPSSYSWLNYSEEKLIERYLNYKAIERGTRLHAIAASLIEEGLTMPRTKKTFDRYVNDAIGFGLNPERPLLYSSNCFGTADAINFEKNKLRIHDLKTGVTPASIKQLEIYAALFCLEYDIRPNDIQTELRIYQNNDVVITKPTGDEILPIMDKIITSDKILEHLNHEGE